MDEDGGPPLLVRSSWTPWTGCIQALETAAGRTSLLQAPGPAGRQATDGWMDGSAVLQCPAHTYCAPAADSIAGVAVTRA